jgi:hypothetical protein
MSRVSQLNAKNNIDGWATNWGMNLRQRNYLKEKENLLLLFHRLQLVRNFHDF